MRAILVDDEKLALDHLQRMLEKDVGGVEIVGTYFDPHQVLSDVEALQPDVVFLDIHMPEINGLRLGEQLKEAVPDVKIIFVTAYDQYALQAFEIYALDYIMKPVQVDRLRQTVLRLKEEDSSHKAFKADQAAPMICCFKQIRFRLSGKEPQAVKWRTSKAQELFAFMLQYREQMIDRSHLMELLWPDFDEARAAQQLYTTIYHIRQTLKNQGLDMVSIQSGNFGSGYRLTLGEVMIDSEEWEKQLKNLSAPNVQTIDKHIQVFHQFEGHYLEEYEYIWAEPERERLRNLWLNHARSLIRFFWNEKNWDDLIAICQRMQTLVPTEEESYYILMKVFDRLDQPFKVEEQYGLLLLRIEQELDTPISKRIINWYKGWKKCDGSLASESTFDDPR